MAQQGNCHVAQHRQTMRRSTIKLTKSVTVTHGISFRLQYYSSSSIGIVLRCRGPVSIGLNACYQACGTTCYLVLNTAWRTVTQSAINALLLFQTSRWPVFQLHAQSQTTRSQYFLDFIQRLTAQVWRLQQFIFATLDQITNVVNVFCLQAVCRTHSQFKIIDWTQQDRIDLRCARWSFGSRFGTFQCSKHVELINQDARRLTDSFFWRDDTIGFDVDNQLVQIGTLFHASRFNGVRNTAHW